MARPTRLFNSDEQTLGFVSKPISSSNVAVTPVLSTGPVNPHGILWEK